MAQITIYLDDEVASLMHAASKSAGISRSQWTADAIRLRLKREWPASIVAMVGTWTDFPTAEEIRAAAGKDVARERF